MVMWTLDASRSIIMAPWSTANAIRSGIRNWGMRFWPQGIQASDLPTVNYNVTRSLYRNDGAMNLGSAFCKPIVDLQVGFMGIPTASTDSETLDDELNACLSVHWPDVLQQAFRDAMRDSKTVIRISRPDVNDPLMTVDEAEHCQIEVVAPEKVQIEYNVANKNIINRAMIAHEIQFVVDKGDIESGQDPEVRIHDVIEIITPTSFQFYDKTDNKFLDSLGRTNKYGFVPLLEMFNEWDTALEDGQSEFETAVPFIAAFHDLMTQGLSAHKYHSTPKVKFKLNDVSNFLRNNFPNVFDETTGKLIPGSEVDWKGREIAFFAPDEDAAFIEAKSVLGDTKTLAEFLIDCICIASQTPEWAFMRVDSGSANSDRNAQTVPFVKKIERKRIMFAKPIQRLLKMAQVIQGRIPVLPTITWEMIRADDEVVFWQGFQQLVMGLEVAHQAGEISDETYMKMLRSFLPQMKSSTVERRQADKDRQKRIKEAQAAIPQSANGTGNPSSVPVLAGPQGKNE
jgi:hypothetical protein